MNANEIRRTIVEKALKDPAFRKALLQDANSAVEKAFGVKIPGGAKIKVVEDTNDSAHLVLPPVSKGELSDAALGGVAGGGDPYQTYLNCIITTQPPGSCGMSTNPK